MDLQRLGLALLVPLAAGLSIVLVLGGVSDPLTILGGLGALVFCFLVVYRNEAAMGLLIVGMAGTNVFIIDRPGLMVSLSDGLLVAYCSGSLLLWAVKERLSFDRRQPYLLLAFVIISGVSLTVSDNFRNSYAAYLRFLLFVAFFFLLVWRIDSLRTARNYLLCFVACAVLALVAQPEQFATLSDPQTYRLSGTLGNPNKLGAYIGAGLIGSLCFVVSASRLVWRWVSLVLTMAFVAALLYTYSRGSWISAAVALLFWLAVNRIKPVKVALFGALGALMTIRGSTITNILTKRPLGDQSTLNRADTYKAGLQAMFDHPWLGIGFDQFDSLYRYTWVPKGAYKKAAHNMYLGVGVEVGLLGLIAFAVVLLQITAGLLRDTFRARLGRDERVLCYTIAALVVHHLCACLFDNKLFSVNFWFVLGMAAGTRSVLWKLAAATSPAAQQPQAAVQGRPPAGRVAAPRLPSGGLLSG